MLKKLKAHTHIFHKTGLFAIVFGTLLGYAVYYHVFTICFKRSNKPPIRNNTNQPKLNSWSDFINQRLPNTQKPQTIDNVMLGRAYSAIGLDGISGKCRNLLGGFRLLYFGCSIYPKLAIASESLYQPQSLIFLKDSHIYRVFNRINKRQSF